MAYNAVVQKLRIGLWRKKKIMEQFLDLLLLTDSSSASLNKDASSLTEIGFQIARTKVALYLHLRIKIFVIFNF